MRSINSSVAAVKTVPCAKVCFQPFGLNCGTALLYVDISSIERIAYGF